MKKSLALKYRPTSFSEMIGQPLTAVVLKRMVETEQVPAGLLFSGPSGTGKTTAARILASELSGVSDDLSVIEIDAASNGGVADVRTLIESLRYSSGGDHRVVIYDEAHSMTRDAFNALLLTLEHPPAGTIFVLVTTEPEKIPGTVQTRLLEFKFRRVTPADILDRLVVIASAEGIDITVDLLQSIAQRAEGNVRTAINTLDQMARAEIKSVAEFESFLGEHDTAPKLIAALLTGDPAQFYPVFDTMLDLVGNPAVIGTQLTSVLRDLYVLRAGGSLPQDGPGTDARKELALRLETERLFAASRILWDLKTKIRVSDDPKGNLEIALMLIAEAFTRGKATSTPSPASVTQTPSSHHVVSEKTAPRKLTLSDLRQRRN